MHVTKFWRLKDWLEVVANLVIILAGLAGAVWWVSDTRADAIANNRQALMGEWTNEGDILSTETRFLTLSLQDYAGDVIGSVRGPGFDEVFDVQAEIGWFASELQLTQLLGRRVEPVASVTVKLIGNGNRLQWEVVGDAPDYLPRATTLWPSPGAL